VKKGAELIFVWGGDGMVQRSVDALAGHEEVALAILPAGTANLLATNLAIPKDIARAVEIGLHGARRKLDVGVVNGERFAVMAGTGFDAIMMRDVNGAAKKSLGRLAYVRGGIKASQARRTRARIRVDGADWFKGNASAVLVGNVGTVSGGLTVFPDASATDGLLEVAAVTAQGAWDWVRVFSRVAGGHPDRSPLVHMSRGKKIDIELGRALPYELDGGDRPPTKHLKIRIEAGAVTLCVPRAEAVARPSRKRVRPPASPVVVSSTAVGAADAIGTRSVRPADVAPTRSHPA
jgi:diacylglycerol kinase (ATP)